MKLLLQLFCLCTASLHGSGVGDAGLGTFLPVSSALEYPYPQYQVVVGNASNDVVLVGSFNSGTTNELWFTQKGDPFDVFFYQGVCSRIQMDRQLGNRTKDIRISKGTQYRLDEPYLVAPSRRTYSFTQAAVDLGETGVNTSLCIANISVFEDRYDYFQFIVTGQVSRPNATYCLTWASKVTFTLSALERNQYYFVGVAAFKGSTLRRTIVSDMLKYNTKWLSPIVGCTFPSPWCSVSLEYPYGPLEICILASLEQSGVFVTLNYTVHPGGDYHGNEEAAVANALLMLGVASLSLVLLLCAMRELSTRKTHTKEMNKQMESTNL